MNIVIAHIEDNQDDVSEIGQLIERYSSEHGLNISVKHFPMAESFIQNYKQGYDAVFMDIELNQMDGLKAAHKLREIDPEVPIFFITNMSQYAIRGYEVHAMDFILKPVNYFSLSMRLDTLVKYLKTFHETTVTIRMREGIKIIPIKNVYYIEIDKHDIVYHTVNGDCHAYGNLNEREKELSKYGFARCGASFLVNMKYIEGVFTENLVIAGNNIPISRRKKKAFMQALGNYYEKGGFSVSSL